MNIPNKTYHSLFFDLDNTLWDFHANSHICLEQLYQEYNLQRFFSKPARFVKVYEEHNFRLWDMYRQGLVTGEEVSVQRFERSLRSGNAATDAAPEMSRRYLELLPSQKELLPNALEVVQQLSTKYTLCIITNGFREVQHHKLRSSGLAPYFSHIITSDDAGVLKPDVRIFELALQQAACPANEALMIGDDFRADILGARQAEIDQVWFLPTGRRTGKATYTIRKLDELVPLLLW